MAVKSVSWYDANTWGGLTFNVYADATASLSISVTGSTFNFNSTGTVKLKGTCSDSSFFPAKVWIATEIYNPSGTKIYAGSNFETGNLSHNTYGNATASSYGSLNTSDYFKSSNSTTRTLSFTRRITEAGAESGTFSSSSISSPPTITTYSVTLNAPPTFTATTTSSGTYYANRSKYTVSVASLSAKYGGTISSAVLSVGSATASRTTNGTLEVTVPSAGTYTPSVKVTDSRGQVTTKNLSAITVVAHTSPSLTATVTSSAPYYNMETDYSASVSDIVTHEGATVSSITLKIGSQTVSRTDAGVLTISTNTAGSFTPTVTILDSFGASTAYSLPAITVNPYVAPTMSFTVQRTLPKTGELTPIGKPDDEGESAVATANISWTSDITELVAPTVVATDADGNLVSVTSEWYTTRASDGTLSDLISDWSIITPSDMPVYGLIGNSTHDAFNTQFSYQIAITPTDDTSSGTAISQTLGSAFYTVDFLAGGHGIAFGQPASEEGFVVNLDSTFNKAVYIELPNYQTADELDKEIYDDLVALGWDTDCLES